MFWNIRLMFLYILGLGLVVSKVLRAISGKIPCLQYPVSLFVSVVPLLSRSLNGRVSARLVLVYTRILDHNKYRSHVLARALCPWLLPSVSVNGRKYPSVSGSAYLWRTKRKEPTKI